MHAFISLAPPSRSPPPAPFPFLFAHLKPIFLWFFSGCQISNHLVATQPFGIFTRSNPSFLRKPK